MWKFEGYLLKSKLSKGNIQLYFVGVNSSLISLLIYYLTGQKVSVKINRKELKIYFEGSTGKLDRSISEFISKWWLSSRCPDWRWTQILGWLWGAGTSVLVGFLIYLNFRENWSSDLGLNVKFLPTVMCRKISRYQKHYYKMDRRQHIEAEWVKIRLNWIHKKPVTICKNIYT